MKFFLFKLVFLILWKFHTLIHCLLIIAIHHHFLQLALVPPSHLSPNFISFYITFVIINSLSPISDIMCPWVYGHPLGMSNLPRATSPRDRGYLGEPRTTQKLFIPAKPTAQLTYLQSLISLFTRKKPKGQWPVQWPVQWLSHNHMADIKHERVGSYLPIVAPKSMMWNVCLVGNV